MNRRILLLCGVLSPILYGVADAVTGGLYEGYSFRDQVISELGAVGAPSRPLFTALLVVVYLLFIAFGVGVWRSAAGRRAVRAGASVRVAIRDRGPGIPEEFKGKIFQKFTQADSSDTRQKGGTGLGLAIAKEMIERMQGTIGFESTAGQGSTFFLELPCSTPTV